MSRLAYEIVCVASVKKKSCILFTYEFMIFILTLTMFFIFFNLGMAARILVLCCLEYSLAADNRSKYVAFFANSASLHIISAELIGEVQVLA